MTSARPGRPLGYLPPTPLFRRVIVESPFAGDVDSNGTYARKCMLDSLRRNEAPMLSHLLYTQVLDDGLPYDRATGILAGFAWRHGAAATVVYLGRGLSDGMRAGVAHSIRIGVPVEVRDAEYHAAEAAEIAAMIAKGPQ